jgi:glycerophosphoryl diester phosphodiesterase
MRRRTPSTEAISHRGDRERFPENSIPAFVAAIEQGADGIELDVHATSDGSIVVHHDAALPADTASPRAGRPIKSLTLSELATFELAPGIGIPTLEEALKTVCASARAYIEIKAADIEQQVADVIASVPNAADKCAIHCFDHRIARRFASVDAKTPTGILLVGYPMDARSVLESAAARDFWESHEFVDKDLIDEIQSAGGRVIAWTCNDPAEWRRLAALRVDGICTDRVGALVSQLRS